MSIDAVKSFARDVLGRNKGCPYCVFWARVSVAWAMLALWGIWVLFAL